MVVTSPYAGKDKNAGALQTRLSLRLPRELQALNALRQAVSEFLKDAGQDELATGRVNLVLVELFTNIVRHSRVRYTDSIVEVRLELLLGRTDSAGLPLPAELALLLESAGPAFEPPATSEDPPALNLKREGGYGLHIVQALCSQVQHLHAHGINQIRCLVPLAQSDDTCCGVYGCNPEH